MKQAGQRLARLRFALISIILSVIIVIGAVAFIRRGFDSLFVRWEETAFYIIVIVTSALSGLFGFGMARGTKERRRQRHLVWSSLLVAFLYIASAALCEKLNVGTVATPLWRQFGLALVTAGAVLRLWAIATLGHFHSGLVTIQDEHKLVKQGPYRRLRHPSYLGVLLACAGMPMVFGTWFPLLALPGIFVGLKWRMDDEDALLAEHFGEEYEEYKKNRWRILPFVY